MPDYGTDISAVPDLDPMTPDVTGRVVLIEALYRRFITPRGSLFYDPQYGYALIELIGDTFGPGDIHVLQTEIAQEALKDERVLAAVARVGYRRDIQTLRIVLSIQDALGPFSLVLAVDNVSVKILNGQTAGFEV